MLDPTTRSLMRGLFAAALLCCLPVDALAAQTTRYVDAAATGPSHDGTTWCSAFLLLQDALAVAGAGDTIRVANGIYTPDQGGGQTPGDRYATFALLPGVTVQGGYAGCGAANPDARDLVAFETILSGDLLGNDGPGFANNDENSLHVVTGAADPSAVLDGFTVTAGNANIYSDNGEAYGAGIFNLGNGSTIIRCKMTGNFAAEGAAGVDSFLGSNVILTEATVLNPTIVSAGSTLTLNQSVLQAAVDVGYSSLLQGSGTLGAGVELCGGVQDANDIGVVRANASGLQLTITGVPTSIAGGDFEALNDGVLLIDTDVTPATEYFCTLNPCPVNLLAEGGGTIFAGQDVIIMAGEVAIGPAGSYESDPAFAGANAAALHAETITLVESLPDGSPGTLAVGGGMTATSAGNLLLDGLLAGSGTSCTPPILNATANASMNVGGDMIIVGSAFIDYTSSQPLNLDGSFDNQSIRPEGFEWREGAMTMTTASGFIEAAGRDNGAASQIAAEYEFGTLEIEAGASVTLEDTFDNDQLGQGVCTEALYVDTLVVEAGATLTLNNVRLYYRNLVNDGTISPVGCGSLVVNPFCSAHGQCDDDDRCTLDTCDVAGQCDNTLGGQAIVHDETLLARSYCSDDNFATCSGDADCAAGTCLKLACLWSEPNPFELTSGTFQTSDAVGTYVEDFHSFFDSIGFLDPGNPSSGFGYWYLVRPTCPVGASWQTVPGAEPGRDAGLP